MGNRVNQKLRKWEDMKTRRRMYESTWTLISRYIEMKEVNFSSAGIPQSWTLIPEELIDTTAAHIASKSAASVLGSMWPNGASSFRLRRSRHLPDTEEVTNWYKDTVNEVMPDVMDTPRAGTQLALEEVVREDLNYGTASMGIYEKEDDDNVPIRYVSKDIKGSYIAENVDGIVDTNYHHSEMNVRQLVREYGIDNVSSMSARLYHQNQLEDKVEILWTVEPRVEFRTGKKGSLNMEFEVMVIELGPNKILRESGYNEFPCPTVRHQKIQGEPWGRSPGMYSIPTVIELQVIWEALTVGFEKYLDPPMAVADDGRFGAGTIDTSPGGVNVFSPSNRISADKSIFPLYTVGSPQGVMELVEKLEDSLNNHYMVDRLLDLNNDTRMTLGEANIRNQLRGDALVSMYRRFSMELFVPMIDRTFNILLERGFFGVVAGSDQEARLLREGSPVTYLPAAVVDAMIRGKDLYKIDFISPAARMMQAFEANGIIQTLQMSVEMKNAYPESVDALDVDSMVRRLALLLNVSEDQVRSAEAVRLIRQQRAEQQQALMQAEMERNQSEVNRNNSQAQATAQSNIPVGV